MWGCGACKPFRGIQVGEGGRYGGYEKRIYWVARNPLLATLTVPLSVRRSRATPKSLSFRAPGSVFKDESKLKK